MSTGCAIQECHIQGRLQGGALFDLVSCLFSEARIVVGNIELRRNTGARTIALTWSETLEELTPNLTLGALRELKANARHAQRFGEPTRLQLAILLYPAELNDFYRDVSESRTSYTETCNKSARAPGE